MIGAACQVRTEITVDVREAGGGTVTVGVGLDDDAVSRVTDPSELVRSNDLEEAGWTVTGPVRQGDGFTWFRATKPFETPEEATAIFGEISGENGPFQGFELVRDRSFARTDLRFEGSVDFRGGLESFSDSELAQSLEGEPLGEPVERIEQRIGATLDRVFQFRVAVRMPGDVESNAPGGPTNGAVWEPKLSEEGVIHLEAATRVWRRGSIIAIVVAGAALLILLAWLLIRLADRTRRRRAAT
ncbi:MAG: hypothetical protein ACRD29_11575 [Acidimicrobiales bacterium]